MRPDPDGAVGVDPAVAAHEARHAAAALLLGLDVLEVRADNPSPDAAGRVRLGSGWYNRPREHAVMILAGKWGDPNWPPEQPSQVALIPDERQIAEQVEALGLGRRGYELLVGDAKHLVGTAEFKSMADMLEVLLASGCILRTAELEQIHKVCGKVELEHKTVKATARTTTELGEFSAIAAAYSIDIQGDQIVRGAFEKTLAAWRSRSRPIPLHWAHLGDAKNIIGTVDPHSAREIREGLFVKGKLDIEGSEMAREAWRLVKSGAVALSFGYMVTDSFKRTDGIVALREIDLFEVSLTPSPANPDTRILNFKSTGHPDAEPEPGREPRTPEMQRVYEEERDHIRTLLDAPLEPLAALVREEKRQARELRREWDRMRLELAMDGIRPERGAA